jgi:glycosyltransferase involved in cell wall biosynthesis
MRIAFNGALLGQKHFGIVSFGKMMIAGLAENPDHQLDVYSSIDFPHVNGNVTLHRTPSLMTAEHGTLGNILRLAWLQFGLAQSVQRHGCDVFVSPSFDAMFSTRIPQVITIHDVTPLLFPEETPHWTLFFKHALPRLIAASTRILADSEHTKVDIMKHYRVDEAKVMVAYPGVDPTFYQSENGRKGSQPSKYFLFVGTFAPRKNLETVVRAFANIASRVEEDLVVVAYWHPENGGRLKSLAEELGVLQRIRFVSGLSTDDLAALYRHATAAVLLSEYEGFGYPAAEAMASGTPVVVSDSTSLAEIAGDAALKVPCGDVADAADAMLSIALDENLQRTLSAAGHERAALYTCERFAEAINAGIKDALR